MLFRINKLTIYRVHFVNIICDTMGSHMSTNQSQFFFLKKISKKFLFLLFRIHFVLKKIIIEQEWYWSILILLMFTGQTWTNEFIRKFFYSIDSNFKVTKNLIFIKKIFIYGRKQTVPSNAWSKLVEWSLLTLVKTLESSPLSSRSLITTG